MLSTNWLPNADGAGELGDKLEKKAQKETKELGKLSFVPWVSLAAFSTSWLLLAPLWGTHGSMVR